jgi:hypothetical protein
MWYMPMHNAELIACIIFLYMKIFVCLIKQAHFLAIVSIFFGGGYDSILWLSFAQQKLNGSGMEKDLGCKAPSLLTVRVTRGGDQPYPEHNASYNARVVKSYKTTSSLLKCFLLLWKNTLHAITPVL